MKKKLTAAAAALAVLLIVLLSLQLRALKSRHLMQEALENSTEAVVISSDKTVLPGFIYNSDAIRADSIAGEKHLHGSSGEKPGLEELCAGAEAIVRAEAVSLSYTFIEGRAYTQADVALREVLKGSLQEDCYISVYLPGGYASAEDFDGEDRGGENRFYRVIYDSLPIPYQGDELLLFINPSPAGQGLPEGSYSLSAGRWSVFNVLDGGKSLVQDQCYTGYDKILELLD